MKSFIALCILTFNSITFATPSIIGNSNSLYGIQWGSSVDEITSTGIKLEKIRSHGRFDFYKTRYLPEKSTIASEFLLIFDNEFELQNIVMLSKAVDDDSTGQNAKQIYTNIKEELIKTYGSPSGEYENWVAILPEEKNFYQCLQFSCQWKSYFRAKDGNIRAALQILVDDLGKGRIVLERNGSKWKEIEESIGSGKSKGVLNFTGTMGILKKYFSFKQMKAEDNNTSVSNNAKESISWKMKCGDVEKLAHSVMYARQSGASMRQMIEVSGGEDEDTVKLTEALIIEAFNKPRYNTESMQEESMKDFSDEMYLFCVKKLRG